MPPAIWANVAEFPPADAAHGEWEMFLTQSFKLSGLVILVGVGVSILTLIIICKVHIRAHHQTSPCIIFLLLLVLNLAGYAASGLYSSFTIWGQAAGMVSDLAVELQDVQDMAEALKIGSGSFQHNLDRLYSECPNATHEFLGESVRERKMEAQDTKEAALVTLRQLDGMPQWLMQRMKDLFSIAAILLCSFLLPLSLLLLCYFALCLLIGVAECAGPRCIRRCLCCQIGCLTASCISPSIVAVSLVVAFEVGFTTMTSAFCATPELLTLSYSELAFGHGSGQVNLTQQYLDDASANVALNDLKVIENHFTLWQEWVGTYGEAIQRSCPVWDATNVSNNIQLMHAGLRDALAILEPAHLYPYYSFTVEDLVCETSISRISVLMTFQLALGLVGLPVLACAASCLLDSLQAERQGFDLLQTDEAEERRERWNLKNLRSLTENFSWLPWS